jgi:anti-sigma B factor antagonist
LLRAVVNRDAGQLEVIVDPAGWAVLECTGEHDLTTRTEVRALLDRLLVGYGLVVVDVSQATFIDSSFVTNLFRANRVAREQGKRLRVQHSTAPIVHRVLEISGVLSKLDCTTSREAALR